MFSAHKNGVDQTGLANATFTKVSFGSEDFDVAGHYDAANSRWMPPTGRVRLSATAYFSAGLAPGGVMELHLYKNGALHRGRTSIAPAATGSIDVSCLADANGSDYFEVFAYATSGATASVYGGVAYTHFSGEQV